VKRVVWVQRETALALHEQLLALFGGATGIRDAGLFESAMARPQQLAAYGRPSVFDLAASYAFGLIRNHPFVDGNKRTGFAVAVLFLQINRERLNAAETDAVVQTLALATGEMSEKAYSAWLERNC
jgi:death on curing protein